MKVLIACDSFKGSCSTLEVARAVAEGVRAAYANATVEYVLVADGGEGTMFTLANALNATIKTINAHDALMRPIRAAYAVLPNATAIIDMAETGGITRIRPEERNPIDATSYGLGEQIADAIEQGCTQLIIGLGGSATTDAGAGMMQALHDRNTSLRNCRVKVLCDVTNPLYGPQGAAYVFAPQKGADPQTVALLDTRLRKIAAESPHPEMALEQGAGAAGGLGFALMCYLDATLVSGIETVLEYQHFDERLTNADLVITGEGKIDRQTLMNKAPLGVLHHAKKFAVPVAAIAGKIEDEQTLLGAGFDYLRCINPPGTPLELAMNPDFAAERIKLTTEQLIKDILI